MEFYNKGFLDVPITGSSIRQKKVSFQSTSDHNSSPNGSQSSIEPIPTQGPIRSYRCQTNISQLPNFTYSKTLPPSFKEEKVRKDRSLFLFSEDGFIRKWCKRLVEKKAFEYFMLLTIAANCVVLMINTPLPSQDHSPFHKKIEMSDYVFVAIFTVESILKIIAYGFVLSPDAYLKSGWNILDFIVVIVGLVQVMAEINGKTQSSRRDDSEAVRALRAVRVLRPLKLVSGVPSLQVLMKSLIRAMVPLLQILLLVLFVIIIYSIVGLELLRGRYLYTCFHKETNVITSNYYGGPRPCDADKKWGRLCADDEVCRKATPSEWLGPKEGITTFDNMFLSMLTVFQCITLEGWSDILYLSMDSRDKKYPIITWSSFVLLIIVGSFFMLNLVLGVLSGEFAKERERVENRKSFLKLRKQRQIDRAVEHYLQWINKAEDLFEDDDASTDDERVDEATRKKRNMATNRNRKATVVSQYTFNNSLSKNGSDVSGDYPMAQKRSRGLKKQSKKGIFHTICKWEKRFRMFNRRLTKSKAFYWCVLIFVFLNTVSMSLYKHNQTEEIANILEITEIAFTMLFFIEMLIRIYALGINGYFRSSFNKYDFLIVWLSIGDLLYKHITSSHTIGISVLRSVRLLRIFKVTRFWSSMQNVVSSLMNSIRSILSLILLLLLFIFIFALLGMQLFGGQFHSVRIGKSHTNFDNFPKAMLAVFQIMTGEDWNSVMYQGISAFDGPKTVKGMLVSLYFVALVIIGNYTLLNVFLAIAVDNLANAQVLTKDEEQEYQLAQEQKKIRNVIYSPQPVKKSSKWSKVRSVPKLLAFLRKKDEKEKNPFKGMTYKPRGTPILRTQSEKTDAVKQKGTEEKNRNLLATHQKYTTFDSASSQISIASDSTKVDIFVQQENENNLEKKTSEERTPTPISALPRWMRNLEEQQNMVANKNAGGQGKKSNTDLPIGLLPMPNACFDMNHSSKILRRRQLPATKVINTRSLFIFSPSSRIRNWCHRIVNMKYFEQFMLVFIILSSTCLAVEDPLDNRKELNEILYYCDIAFIAIFTFEILIKLIDQGAILHKGSYLRDTWNLCDTIVVACNIAAVVITLQDTNGTIGISVAAMRILRVFRSLRVVNKIKSLKVVFQCVVFSLKRVINIIIIAVLVLFMFAVIGCHLFKGRFYYCNDTSKLTKEECQGYFYFYKYPIWKPENFTVAKRIWRNYPFNFDSVPISMLTLFTCGTGEGWPIVMQKSIDASGEDMGPIPDNNMFMSLFYVCFVVIFSFFFLNIFVALIIVTFQEQGEKEITGSELDKNQRACLQFVLNSKPRQRFMPIDKSGFSHKVWRIVDSKPFEIMIMILISLNAITLMLSYDGQSSEYEMALEHVNMIFTFLFTIEAILKLIAYKQNYFRDSWNVFDFCIVFLTLIGAVLMLTSKGQKEDFPIDPSFFRLFRAFRLLKLLRQGYNIRILLWTFLQSLRALPYVVLLIAMLFFIYAVIGMLLFSNIKLDSKKHINEYNNFQGFLNAIGVLFRCGTGEAWHLVMLDCFDEALCLKGSSCGSTVAAVVYFCSFYFFYAFLLLNLFVAVIMDNFDYLTRDESILGPHHMDEFVRVWSEYDPSASGRIPHEDIYQLMCDMQPPVGFGKKCPRFLAYKRLMKLNMPISGDNTVLFTPTLFALVRTSLGMTHVENECFRDSSFRKIIKKIWPNVTIKTLDVMMPEQTVLSGQQITIGKIYAAKLIYESFKEIKRRKNCTLPQFEMFEATHKRGNSFFRKMMGVLRTSSQPLVVEKEKRPREELLTRRRRSNTMSQIQKGSGYHLDLCERHSNPVRIRSVSNCGLHRESFATRLRKTTLPYLPSYSSQTQSMDVIPNTLAACSSSCLSSYSDSEASFKVPKISVQSEKFFPRRDSSKESSECDCNSENEYQGTRKSSDIERVNNQKEILSVKRSGNFTTRKNSKLDKKNSLPKLSYVSKDRLFRQKSSLGFNRQSSISGIHRQPSTSELTRQPSSTRLNRQPSSSTLYRQPSSSGSFRRPSSPGLHRLPSMTGIQIQHSPPELFSQNVDKEKQEEISAVAIHQNSSVADYFQQSASESSSSSIENESSNKPWQQEDLDRDSKLTDTLITALRDPAKPILCFVNPQIHRENRQTVENELNSPASDIPTDRRTLNQRTRQKRVTVSLPMIQLEIPVERDSDFIDIGSRTRYGNVISPDDANVPDILKNLSTRNTVSSSTNNNNNNNNTSNITINSTSNNISNNSFSIDETHNNDSSAYVLDNTKTKNISTDLTHSHSNTDREQSDSSSQTSESLNSPDNSSGSSETNRDLLLELNNHLNKAISDGNNPHWIYKINERDENTWC